jgi:hypothetical protein
VPPAAAGARGAASAAAAPTGALAGVVRDTAGTPRPGAQVRLSGVAEREARTDAAGRFRLDGLPLGTGTLLVRSIGLAPQRVPVAVRLGDPAEVEVTVQRVAVLTGVTVRAMRARRSGAVADVAGRQRLGFGHYVDTTLLRQTQSVRAALTRVPFADVRYERGAWAVYFRQPGQSVYASAGQTMCQAKVVVDGLPSTWDLVNTMSPDEIWMIEVYRRATEVPAQYQTLAGLCGSVLIWTDQSR